MNLNYITLNEIKNVSFKERKFSQNLNSNTHVRSERGIFQNTFGYFLVLILMFGINLNAQVSHLLNPTYGYTFLNTTTTYTPLTGGTVFQSGTTLNTDAVSSAITLPFTFTFNN